MHPEATEFVVKAIQQHGPFARVLEVGSRDVNGTIKSHFMEHGTTYYCGVDLEDGPNVDVIIDFSLPYLFKPSPWTTQSLNFRPAFFSLDNPFDAVVCVNTLEHTPEGRAITANAYRVLRDDGYFIMSAAHNWPAHGAFDGGLVREGEWYRNVTEEEVKEWVEYAGFDEAIVSLDHMRRDVRLLARK